jgi:hypothetical protein
MRLPRSIATVAVIVFAVALLLVPKWQGCEPKRPPCECGLNCTCSPNCPCPAPVVAKASKSCCCQTVEPPLAK